MRKHISVFFAGVGVSALVGFGLHAARHRQNVAQRGSERASSDRDRGVLVVGRGRNLARGMQPSQESRTAGDLDLNQCSLEQLRELGVDEITALRIIELRPYRSKLELVSRVMLVPDVYGAIKDRVFASNADEAIKVA